MDSITVTSDLRIRNVVVHVGESDARLGTAVAQHTNIFTVYLNDCVSTEFMTFDRKFITPVRNKYRYLEDIAEDGAKLARERIMGDVTHDLYFSNFAALRAEYAETERYLQAQSYLES